MGMCCTKPIVTNHSAYDDAHHRTTLILHAYHDLPESEQGSDNTRKRRGSFVLIEHNVPNKKIRTNEMIACLEEYLNNSQQHEDNKN